MWGAAPPMWAGSFGDQGCAAASAPGPWIPPAAPSPELHATRALTFADAGRAQPATRRALTPPPSFSAAAPPGAVVRALTPPPAARPRAAQVYTHQVSRAAVPVQQVAVVQSMPVAVSPVRPRPAADAVAVETPAPAQQRPCVAMSHGGNAIGSACDAQAADGRRRRPQSAGAIPQNLLKRIDGVVSDMERELCEDLAAAESPAGAERATPSPGGAGASQIEWIDKQIMAIETRREACEMRQAHLADLRKIVIAGGASARSPGAFEALHDGAGGGASTTMSPPGTATIGASAEDALAAGAEGAAVEGRLSALALGHEQLKKQVRGEREELARIRQALDAAEDGRREAWSAEAAAQRRSGEASLEARALQEEYRRAEAALELCRAESTTAQQAQVAVGADLRLAEENSRVVLQDCRDLRAKVQELEAKRIQEKRELETSSRLWDLQRQDLEHRQHALQEELQRSKALLDSSASSREKMQAEEAVLRRTLDTQARELEAEQAQAKRLAGAVDDRHGAFRQLRSELDEVQAQRRRDEMRLYSELREHKYGATSEAQALHRLKEELAGQVRSGEAAVRERERVIASLQQRVAESESEHRSREEQLYTAQRQHGELRVSHEYAELRHKQVEEANAKLLKAKEAEERARRELEQQHWAAVHSHSMDKRNLEDSEMTARVEWQRTHEATLEAHTALEASSQRLQVELEMTSSGRQQVEADLQRARREHSEVSLQLYQFEAELMKHRQEMADMQAGHEAATEQAAEGWERRHAWARAELLDELTRKHRDEQDKLHVEHGRRVAQLEAERIAMQKEHCQSYQDLKSDYTATLLDAARIRDEHQAAAQAHEDLAARHGAAAQEAAQLRNEHLEAVLAKQDLEAKCGHSAWEVTALKDEHKSATDELRQRLHLASQELAMLRESHRSEVEDRASRHGEEVRQIKGEQAAAAREMEQALQAARTEERRRHDELGSRQRQLQEERDRLLAERDRLQGSHRLLESELEAARRQVQHLQRAAGDLDAARSAALQRETTEARLRERVQVLEAERGERDARIAELESKLRETQSDAAAAEEAHQRLEGLLRQQLDDRGRQAEGAKPANGARKSLWSEAGVAPRWRATCGSDAGSEDPCAQKVREAGRGAEMAVAQAGCVQVQSIRDQLDHLRESRRPGRGLGACLQDFRGRRETDAERGRAASSLEAAMQKLRALTEETEAQRRESKQDGAGELARRQQQLSAHTSRCREELALLRASLADAPDPVVEQLLVLAAERAEPRDASRAAASVAQWATQAGRRDILEFVRAQEGGAALGSGRSCAGESRQTLPGEEGPADCSRPSTGGLPAVYTQALNQIELHGWSAMKWKENYTMLHWAAEKGRLDIARYLLRLGAEADKPDDSGRTPIDAARRCRHYDVAALLLAGSRAGQGYERNLSLAPLHT